HRRLQQQGAAPLGERNGIKNARLPRPSKPPNIDLIPRAAECNWLTEGEIGCEEGHCQRRQSSDESASSREQHGGARVSDVRRQPSPGRRPLVSAPGPTRAGLDYSPPLPPSPPSSPGPPGWTGPSSPPSSPPPLGGLRATQPRQPAGDCPQFALFRYEQVFCPTSSHLVLVQKKAVLVGAGGAVNAIAPAALATVRSAPSSKTLILRTGHLLTLQGRVRRTRPHAPCTPHCG